MCFNKPDKLFIIDPDANTAIKKNETKIYRFLEKFFIVPAGTPLIPNCIAFLLRHQHIPTFATVSTLPLLTSSIECNKGHTSTHLKTFIAGSFINFYSKRSNLV